jgi:Zn-dependent protease
MAEIERLQHKKSSWVGGAVVLVISLLMFLWLGIGKGTGAFASKEAREMLLLLVAILFFHELGHYVAMRVFRYRNVRMFFIPLFGAAVSGTHYSAPGWKKVVVALMGPLPGIVVGAGLGIAGIVMHHAFMMKVALMLLILNGSNLLPVLPLDGGRVVQTLLFARHYAVDVAFRLLAAVALIALTVFLGGRIYMALGISMLLSVPLVWQRGRIATELRRAGMGPQPSDDQRIPPELARAIITRVMSGTSKSLKQGNRAVAQTTLAIYETLCNRPPGWLATLGLGAVHVLAVLLALALGIFVAIAQGGPLARFARAAAQGPRQSISPTDIVAVGDHQPAVARKTVVANFAKSAEARSAYIALSQNLGPGEAVERFGQTVLLAFPAADEPARRRHLADVERLTKDFSVDVPQRGGARFRLNCIAPDDATAALIQAQVDEYTRLPRELRLIPPWSPAASDPQTDWPRCRLARQTYQRLERAGRVGPADPAQKELGSRIRDAVRSGDTAELERLRAEQTQRMQERRHDELERLRTLHDGSVDPVVVENYLRLPAQSAASSDEYDDEASDSSPLRFNNPAYQAIAARMAQIPLVNGKPAPGAARFSSYGFMSREGLLLTFHYWTFEDDVEGAPALVRWLADHGCRSMHYDFHNGNAFANPFE